MSVDDKNLSPLVAHLRETLPIGINEKPWPADLTEDEQVAYMELMNDDFIAVLSIDSAFARKCIEEGSIEAGLAAMNRDLGYELVDGEWVLR